jgi:hypothetical protein
LAVALGLSPAWSDTHTRTLSTNTTRSQYTPPADRRGTAGTAAARRHRSRLCHNVSYCRCDTTQRTWRPACARRNSCTSSCPCYTHTNTHVSISHTHAHTRAVPSRRQRRISSRGRLRATATTANRRRCFWHAFLHQCDLFLVTLALRARTHTRISGVGHVTQVATWNNISDSKCTIPRFFAYTHARTHSHTHSQTQNKNQQRTCLSTETSAPPILPARSSFLNSSPNVAINRPCTCQNTNESYIQSCPRPQPCRLSCRCS